ncbi:hypothetical protein O3G_MSEX014867 [Manduca sexta]|uniref:Uncharacterized protein n=1 Tax=Manduca sexta TaxID=7130 RepID=A0A921ZWN1_MANSE|nr:hypothetical protein O3G_MSEX014867 [Manduca sexta]
MYYQAGDFVTNVRSPRVTEGRSRRQRQHEAYLPRCRPSRGSSQCARCAQRMYTKGGRPPTARRRLPMK